VNPQPWWRDAVVLEVYPRSFADSDGDGVGDLAGIAAHLDHVAALGADAVWLTPFQRSPQADHGYDVADYCDVDPLFGDLAGFDALLGRAHDLGLRMIIDLVANHCSIEHPLFRAALAAGPGSSERARFHFRPGRGPGGGQPPNDWPSVFGGPAWTRVTEPDGTPGEWYLHLYTPEQPDWNWADPRTAALFDDVLRFWFDRGVDGLRIDVAHGFTKAAGLPDLGDLLARYRPMRLGSIAHASDQEGNHEIFRGWRRIADSYDPPRMLVGEVNLPADRQWRYTRRDELHQAFAFDLVSAPWSARAWRTAVSGLLTGRNAGGAACTWAVENHDVLRTPTRYGGGDRGAARARAALLAVLGLPGAVYLYQGQELGLPEAEVPPDRRQDPAFERTGTTRDGARVPIPWTRHPAGAHGFSPGGGQPWLPVPDGWGRWSVEEERDDPGSALSLTRSAVALRRKLHADGVLDADDAVEVELTGDDALIARRPSGFALVVAMGDRPARLPAGAVLLASAETAGGLLPADAAAWVLAPA
jgi:alpha-glucosidase